MKFFQKIQILLLISGLICCGKGNSKYRDLTNREGTVKVQHKSAAACDALKVAANTVNPVAPKKIENLKVGSLDTVDVDKKKYFHTAVTYTQISESGEKTDYIRSVLMSSDNCVVAGTGENELTGSMVAPNVCGDGNSYQSLIEKFMSRSMAAKATISDRKMGLRITYTFSDRQVSGIHSSGFPGAVEVFVSYKYSEPTGGSTKVTDRVGFYLIDNCVVSAVKTDVVVAPLDKK